MPDDDYQPNTSDQPEDNDQSMPPSSTRPRRARCAAAESKSRTYEALLLIVQGKTKAEIRREFKAKYNLRFRQTDRYTEKARAELTEETGLSTRQLRDMSYGFYMNVLTHPAASMREKLKARELADELLGLKAPQKVAVTDSKGDDIYRKVAEGMTDEEISVVKRAYQRGQDLCTSASPSSPN